MEFLSKPCWRTILLVSKVYHKSAIIKHLLAQLHVKTADHSKLFHRPPTVSLSIKRDAKNVPYLAIIARNSGEVVMPLSRLCVVGCHVD